MKRAGILQVYAAVIAATPYSVADPKKVTEYADTIISHIDKTYPEDPADDAINKALQSLEKIVENMTAAQRDPFSFPDDIEDFLDDEELADIPEMKPKTAADKDREEQQEKSKAFAKKPAHKK